MCWGVAYVAANYIIAYLSYAAVLYFSPCSWRKLPRTSAQVLTYALTMRRLILGFLLVLLFLATSMNADNLCNVCSMSFDTPRALASHRATPLHRETAKSNAFRPRTSSAKVPRTTAADVTVEQQNLEQEWESDDAADEVSRYFCDPTFTHTDAISPGCPYVHPSSVARAVRDGSCYDLPCTAPSWRTPG
jgi:hypothetical protein